MTMHSSFDQVLDAIEHLPLEQQAELVDLVKKRLAEQGRKLIVQDIQQGLDEHSKGQSKVTTVDDLMREIGI